MPSGSERRRAARSREVPGTNEKMCASYASSCHRSCSAGRPWSRAPPQTRTPPRACPSQRRRRAGGGSGSPSSCGSPVTLRRGLSPEERPVQLPRLCGREPRRRENLNGLVGHLPLRTRKRWRVAIPAQASANIGVYAAAFASQLVRHAMQFAYLVEQRFELLLVDRATLLVRRACPRSLKRRRTYETGRVACPSHGRTWDRTRDLSRVKRALSR